MDGQTANVFDWLTSHKDEINTFLEEYISYRSPTEHEETVQREFIQPFFENEMPFDEVNIVDVSDAGDRPNVNGIIEGAGNGRNLLFNGHSDVVDVNEDAKADWTYDPWDATIEDDILYGRGSNDMKGPNTAMVWAVKAIAESDIDLEGDLIVSLSVGEEFGQGRELGAAPAVQSLLNDGYDIDLCVVGEPTNLEIQNKSSFLFDYEITIEGKSTHASNKGPINYPQRRGIPDGEDVGVDAGKLMTDIVKQFEQLEHEWNMQYRDTVWGSGGHPEPTDLAGVGGICLTNCIMEAGEYIAGVPGTARIYGNVYGPPSVDMEQLWGEMQDAVDALATTNHWLVDHPPDMDWKLQFDFPAIQTPLDHPGCGVLDDAVSDIRGEQAIFSGFKAVNDGSFIYADCGVDVVTFGPGHISMNAHGADEYLPLDQFHEAVKIYAKLILEWCGTSS